MNVTISKRTVFWVVLAVLLLVPALAVAQSVFDDVPDTSAHIDGITFVAQAGVSLGCDANNNFCPDDPVDRDQMATFLYRLSGNDPSTPPSVRAATADDAATLGGLTPTEVMPVIDGVACADVGGCADVPTTTETVVLSLEIEVPSDGVVAGGYSVTGEADAVSTWHTWLSLNDATCNFVTQPTAPLPGSWQVRSFDGEVTFGGTAAGSVFDAPAGTHTLYLCTVISGDTLVLLDAQLSSTWSGRGAGSTLTGSPALSAAKAASVFGD